MFELPASVAMWFMPFALSAASDPPPANSLWENG